MRTRKRIAFSLAGWLAGAAAVIGQEPGLTTVGFEAPPSSPAACATCAPSVSAVSPVAVGDCTPGRGGRFYGSIDYLIFDFRDGPSPALVQHLPAGRFNNGNLNADDAITIYGGDIDHNGFSGFLLTAGAWVNDNYAVEASYARFEVKNNRFFIASPGDPPIGRFYVDTTNSERPNTYLIYSRPDGSESGYINVEAPLKFWHADVNVRGRGTSVFADRFDWLAGFRYVDLREGIFVQDFIQFNQNGPGNSLFGEDRFYATNQFYGAQVGGNSFFELGGGFYLDATGKVAVGGVRQEVRINGVTIERQNGIITRVVPGDVLTQPSNIGDYDRCKIAIVPEVAVKLGYRVGSRLAVTIGYDFIFVSSVMRAGSAIDTNINPNQSPYLQPNGQSDAQRPGFAFNATDFWAQGLTLGVALTY